jgi:hypothetical protein
VKRYQPKTFDEFVAEKEAEEKAERANDKTQRGTYAGGTIG